MDQLQSWKPGFTSTLMRSNFKRTLLDLHRLSAGCPCLSIRNEVTSANRGLQNAALGAVVSATICLRGSSMHIKKKAFSTKAPMVESKVNSGLRRSCPILVTVVDRHDPLHL